MSLFKVREFWVAHCTEDEQFDQNSLKVARLNSDFEFIITGSHSGIIRIFSALIDSNGYKADDCILEKNLLQPILQIQTGRFVSGSLKTQLCVLFPKNVTIYQLQTKAGATEHGNQHYLQLMYEHKLKRTPANVVTGPFGGTQNRDFICVQSLDGILTFFEQESFAFCCFLPDFLLPDPIVYIEKTDSFVTTCSNWTIQSYRYKHLSENSQNENEEEKKVECTWCFNLSEAVLDIKVLCDINKNVSIMVLGERNLYCIGENGRQKFMKKLDYAPICFTAYILDDDKVLSLIISETNTLLIYQMTTLKWSAQLTLAPIAISRAFFENIKGVIILLSEEGTLQCCYLGTNPSIFTAPPLTNQELDFEKVDVELTSLNKIIKNSFTKDATIMNVSSEKDLSLSISVNKSLEYDTLENKSDIKNTLLCPVTIQVSPRILFDEVQVTIFVQRPLKAEPQVAFFTNLHQEETFKSSIYICDDNEVPELNVEVVASCILGTGLPRTISKKDTLPIKLVYEMCPPEKEAKNKIILNINQNPLPLSTLFQDVVEDFNANAIGFRNKFMGQSVSILTAKSSERYRIQSDSLATLNVIVQDMITRLKRGYEDNKEFSISYTSSLPIAQVIEYVNRHFEARQNYNYLMKHLSQLGAQFRLIQKRLISKYKTKNPTPLFNLELLMDDTHTQILTLTEKLNEAVIELNRAQINLSCVLNLVASLVKLTDFNQEVVDLIESTFSTVYDIEGQNWEDTIDASLCFLLRTVLAKSEKDRLRAPHTSFEEIKEIEKVEKHLTHVLERLTKKGPILETHFDVSEDKKEDKEEETHELTLIGSKIAESSSRALSARKSLLKRRQKGQEE